jgi:adenylate cyclase
VARALPLQTRRTLIYRMAARVARGESDRAGQLALQALALDPSLSSEYILIQELFKDRAVVCELVRRACAAGLPTGTSRLEFAS